MKNIDLLHSQDTILNRQSVNLLIILC